jgi:hypothetical protein
VTGVASLGSTAVGGAQFTLGTEGISVCQPSGGGALVDLNTDYNSVRIPQNTRMIVAQSQQITGLTGSFNVGLCYRGAAAANFNDNDWVNVTVLVTN